MKTNIIVLVSVILIIISLIIYYLNVNVNDTKKNWITQDKAPKILDLTDIKCKNGCPDKNDKNNKNNKIYKFYKTFDNSRNSNNVYKKNKGSSATGPSNLFIMRHGEREAIPVGLDCNGIYRSSNIVNLIEKLNEMGYGIDYIVVPNPNIDTSSMHIEQTMLLASWLLNIPLFIFGTEKESQISVEQVYSNKIFNNKNVIFCWEHTCIQDLLSNIISIGSAVKNIPNKAFLDKSGNLSLPYWEKYNYQTVIHINENFEDTIYSAGIETCFKKENSTLVFGKQQLCSQQ